MKEEPRSAFADTFNLDVFAQVPNEAELAKGFFSAIKSLQRNNWDNFLVSSYRQIEEYETILIDAQVRLKELSDRIDMHIKRLKKTRRRIARRKSSVKQVNRLDSVVGKYEGILNSIGDKLPVFERKIFDVSETSKVAYGHIFAGRLMSTRIARGFSREQLANRLHVAANTLYYWENAQRQPNFQTLSKICQVLKCSADYLIGLSDN